MKQRTGFISNSSSSSFIIASSRPLVTAKDLQNLLFTTEIIINPYFDTEYNCEFKWGSSACKTCIERYICGTNTDHKSYAPRILPTKEIAKFIYNKMSESIDRVYLNRKKADLFIKQMSRGKTKYYFYYVDDVEDKNSDIEVFIEGGRAFESIPYYRDSHH